MIVRKGNMSVISYCDPSSSCERAHFPNLSLHHRAWHTMQRHIKNGSWKRVETRLTRRRHGNGDDMNFLNSVVNSGMRHGRCSHWSGYTRCWGPQSFWTYICVAQSCQPQGIQCQSLKQLWALCNKLTCGHCCFIIHRAFPARAHGSNALTFPGTRNREPDCEFSSDNIVELNAEPNLWFHSINWRYWSLTLN